MARRVTTDTDCSFLARLIADHCSLTLVYSSKSYASIHAVSGENLEIQMKVSKVAL